MSSRPAVLDASSASVDVPGVRRVQYAIASACVSVVSGPHQCNRGRRSAMLLRLSVLLLMASLLLVDIGTVADARKSKATPKSKSPRRSTRSTTGIDWQALLRAGEGRRAADALLARVGISGGVTALGREPTDVIVSRAMATSTDEWELYALGAVLLREYSGDQRCVKAGLALLGRIAAHGGPAATPADELGAGIKYKVMNNMMPCKEQGPDAPDCHPFRTLPMPPQPGETARVRRAIGGWVGESLAGATVGETVPAVGEMVVTLLSQEPLIATVSNFITANEASRLVEITTSAINSRLPGGDLCVKPERTQSLARVSIRFYVPLHYSRRSVTRFLGYRRVKNPVVKALSTLGTGRATLCQPVMLQSW